MKDEDLEEMERDPGAYANWTRIPDLIAEIRRLRADIAKRDDVCQCRYPQSTGVCTTCQKWVRSR